MRTRTHSSMHPGSFLAGIVIGIAAILVLVVTLPGSHLTASSSAAQNRIIRSLDQAEFQLNAAWNHAMIKVKSFSISMSIRHPCLSFGNWYNTQDEKFVAFLAQHGMYLALWPLPLNVCG
jgi:hypothetical protein